MRRPVAHQAGFTLVEMLIALGSSVVILGTLIAGALGLQKSMRASEEYATRQAEQRRMIDYIARDLRRSIFLGVRNGPGAARQAASGSILLSGTTTLEAVIPGYYKVNTPGSAGFDEALPVVMLDDGADYGRDGKAAPTVNVGFRKIFVGAEKSVCFVREEAGTTDIIVRDAENLEFRATISADGKMAALECWFRPRNRKGSSVISSFDQVMLRNQSGSGVW